MPAPDPSDPAIKTQRQPLEKCHSPIVRKLDKEGYFMHGAEARKVRAFNTQFNFEHVDDISSSRPGLFDGAYPPLPIPYYLQSNGRLFQEAFLQKSTAR